MFRLKVSQEKEKGGNVKHSNKMQTRIIKLYFWKVGISLIYIFMLRKLFEGSAAIYIIFLTIKKRISFIITLQSTTHIVSFFWFYIHFKSD